jgi:hypothetical protein
VEGVDLARHLGVAAVRPFGTLLRFDRAPEQGRILRRKPAELKLHGGDLGTLLGLVVTFVPKVTLRKPCFFNVLSFTPIVNH